MPKRTMDPDYALLTSTKTPESTLTRYTVKINNFNYFKYWSYLLLTFYAFGNAKMESFRQLLEK